MSRASALRKLCSSATPALSPMKKAARRRPFQACESSRAGRSANSFFRFVLRLFAFSLAGMHGLVLGHRLAGLRLARGRAVRVLLVQARRANGGVAGGTQGSRVARGALGIRLRGTLFGGGGAVGARGCGSGAAGGVGAGEVARIDARFRADSR